MDSKTIWAELLDYARWSPSPHNVQPWLLKPLSVHEADLYYDPTRLLPIEDPPGRFMTVGFGIFIETLSVAASAQGLKVHELYSDVLLDSTKSTPVFFAKLKLEKLTTNEPLDRELIKLRRTSRLAYTGPPVAEAVLQELQQTASAFDQHFDYSQDEALVSWILQLNCDTLFDDMQVPDTKREIGIWLRYSASQAQAKADGLWSYCLNVPAHFLYLVFNQGWIMRLPIVNSYIKNKYIQTTQGTKTVGWFYGSFAKPKDWLKAGRMLARSWLILTKHGIALHPFGSIITNTQSHAKVREKFNLDEQKTPLWLLVRLGSSPTPPRSHRLSIDDLLLHAD